MNIKKREMCLLSFKSHLGDLYTCCRGWEIPVSVKGYFFYKPKKRVVVTIFKIFVRDISSTFDLIMFAMLKDTQRCHRGCRNLISKSWRPIFCFSTIQYWHQMSMQLLKLWTTRTKFGMILFLIYIFLIYFCGFFNKWDGYQTNWLEPLMSNLFRLLNCINGFLLRRR